MIHYRAVIYARYSSTIQNPLSIKDQITLCKLRAKEELNIDTIDYICQDEAISGEILARPGLQEVLKLAKSGLINIVITEALDRLSRKGEHLYYIYDSLQFSKIKLWTCQEKEIDLVHVGMVGMVSQMHNENLRHKIKRSHLGRALEGKFPAGLAYGYRVVRDQFDARGEVVRGLREIDPDQAKIIKRIFNEFVKGIAVKEIVRGLNNDNIPAFKGNIWRPTALKGSGNRQDGILCNALYNGQLVYNKSSKIRSPETGKKNIVMNPESAWIKYAVPHLKIIDDPLWEKVQARLSQTARKHVVRVKPENKSTEKYINYSNTRSKPLTGLIYCGVCGGLKTIANNDRYVCSNYRYKRDCTNARGLQGRVIAQYLFYHLKDHIINHGDWYQQLKIDIDAFEADILRKQASIQETKAKIDKLIDAIEQGVDPSEVKDRLSIHHSELNHLKASCHKMDFSNITKDAMEANMVIGLSKMHSAIETIKFYEPIKELLGLIIERIDLHPIRNKRSGEEIVIHLKKDGWPDFYHKTRLIWPGIF